MTFENPIWLYLTPLILLVTAAILFFGSRQRDTLLGKFAAARLLGQLTAQASPKRIWLKSICILLAVTGIGLALARPQYGIEWSERKARGLDLVFVLDSSKSMLATDLRPNRLARAKLAVVDLIQKLESDRIGLVAFAGRAFLQTPPTLDYAAFRESLESIGPSSLSRGGSDLGGALREAEKAFPQDNNFKAIILLTDGEDLGGDAIDAAQELAEKSIKVYAIGIGTPEGEILQVRNRYGTETTVRDNDGQPVRTRLDEAALVQISQITGGRYCRLSTQSLDWLYNSVLSTLPRAERESELQEKRIERFQWLLAGALVFLVLEMLIRRRGRSALPLVLFGAACCTLLPQPMQAQAAPLDEQANQPQEVSALYNQAYQALQSGGFETAQGLYENAIRSSKDLQLQTDALYNLGHAEYQIARKSYQAGSLEDALKQMQSAEARFKSVLEIEPNDADAAQDLQQVTQARTTIEQLIQQQQEQEKQEQQDQQEQEQQHDQQEQEQQQDSGEQQEQPGDSQQDGSQQDESQQDGSQQDESDQSSQQESAQNESDAQSENGEQSEPTQHGESADSQQSPGDQVPLTEDSPSEGADASAQAGTPQEGMSEAEAQALLDSLRGGEKLLPLAAPRDSNATNDIRDW